MRLPIFRLRWRNDLRVPRIQALATTFVVSTLLLGCENSSIVRGLQPSDTQFSGKRDLNYDHIIVPGKRIGPVEIGGSVKAALAHLGNPDRVVEPWNLPRFQYHFLRECLWLGFDDDGLNFNPTVLEVGVTCDKWVTKTGIKVGVTVEQAIAKPTLETAYCFQRFDESTYVHILDKRGMSLSALHKNAPIHGIGVYD